MEQQIRQLRFLGLGAEAPLTVEDQVAFAAKLALPYLPPWNDLSEMASLY